MKNNIATVISTIALLFGGPAIAQKEAINIFEQDGVAILAVTNKHPVAIYVGVDGVWQGTVSARSTAYMPVEGFATLDSGFDAEGNLNIKHAFGGFRVRPQMDFNYRSVTPYRVNVPDKPGETKETMIEGVDPLPAANANDQGILWITVGEPPYDRNPLQLERMVKMQEDRPAADWTTQASKLGEPYLVSGSEAVKAAGAGSSAGGKVTVYGGRGSAEEKAGETFTNGIGMAMIAVKPGRVNGARWEWDSGFENFKNRGVRQIAINQGYYLAQTEVTQAQWRAVMANTPSGFKGDNLPVEEVSWNEAVDFCKRLTQREAQAGKLPKGYAYTLPSEDQWEYACRAGTEGDYAGALDGMAWYDANSGERTHPVGTKAANAWGFHDMHGNVWEWCADAYKDGRAYRGGSWRLTADFCRSGYRLQGDPGGRFRSIGFRPALVPSK